MYLQDHVVLSYAACKTMQMIGPPHMSCGLIPGFRISIQQTISPWYHIQAASRIQRVEEATITHTPHKQRVRGMQTNIKSLPAIHIQVKIQGAAEEAREQKDVRPMDQLQVQELELVTHEELVVRQVKR